ncbi:Ig-like domain-containing protein [Frondihabitans cladoniiphilus]|uniref:SDR-like Ig domain-containing protein n=1 Tax=Frondihabitans cladoniiphilus TaxID=715785 RepID=A0ABP8VUY5_9MICO
MRLITRSKKSLALLALTPLVAAAALTLGVALPSQAAPADLTITGVSVNPGDPVQGSQVTTDVTLQVPSTAKSGDTATLTLSSHLRNIPGDFTVYDNATPTPNAIATVHIDKSQTPALVTFTLLPYVDTHTDVHGDAFIKSDFDYTTTPTGVGTPFTSVTGDGRSFTTIVTPTGGPLAPGDSDAYGTFADADNGRTNPAGFLVYTADTALNPADGSTTQVTLNQNTTGALSPTDVGTSACPASTAGFTFESGSLDSNDNLASFQPVTPLSASCLNGVLTVAWPNVPAGTTPPIKYRVVAPVDRVVVPGDTATPLSFFATSVFTNGTGGPTASSPIVNTQSSAGGQLLGTIPTSLSIAKGDTAGNAADTDATAAAIPSSGSIGLVYTVTNTGLQPVTGVSVSDQVVANGTVSGLACDFSAFTGTATATTFAGSIPVGASFTCTAQLTGVSATGAHHHDVATVTATGVTEADAATASNDYYAVAAVAAPVPAAAAPAAPAAAELAFTGSNPTVPLGIAALLLAFGAGILVIGRRRHVER